MVLLFMKTLAGEDFHEDNKCFSCLLKITVEQAAGKEFTFADFYSLIQITPELFSIISKSKLEPWKHWHIELK
jgi:hypothetical protein